MLIVRGYDVNVSEYVFIRILTFKRVIDSLFKKFNNNNVCNICKFSFCIKMLNKKFFAC